MAKHAVVRTDLMIGTDVRSELTSVRYMGEGETPTAIDNGNVVKIDELIEGERELYKGVTPKANDPIEEIVLIATPEVMYDELKSNLDDYYNDEEEECRAYRLHSGDVFSVTKEALDGVEQPAVGNTVELKAGTKLNVAATGTSGSTVIGKIIEVDNTGRYTYYAILVDPVSAPAKAAEPQQSTEASVPEQTKDFGEAFGNKKVSDLISADTKIGSDGSVTGTLNYVSGWTQFSSDNSEQSGNFFPIKLDEKHNGKKIVCTGTKTKTAQDLEWILRVASTESKFSFKEEGGSDFLTLTFKKATLASNGGA